MKRNEQKQQEEKGLRGRRRGGRGREVKVHGAPKVLPTLPPKEKTS